MTVVLCADAAPHLRARCLHDDPGFDMWSDNTRLFASVRDGWGPTDPIVAQGIIHIRVFDFLRQLTTFRVRSSPSASVTKTWLGRFGSFFFGELWDTYVRDHVPATAS